MSIIDLEHLTKTYYVRDPSHNWKTSVKEAVGLKKKKTLTALNDVSLNIQKNEIFGILGPNGAGKTTMLKIIAGLLIPNGGEATVCGFDALKERQDVRASCSFLRSGGWIIFDYKYPLYKNLIFWAVVMGAEYEEVKEEVDAVLKVVGLHEKKSEFPESLSAGERQKLNLARCLLAPRPIFLLDEPTVNIDPYSANFIREYVKNTLVKERDMTVLLATHNLWEAEMICDRIAILHQGRILEVDKTENLKRRFGTEEAVFKIKGGVRGLKSSMEDIPCISDVVVIGDVVKVFGRDLRNNFRQIIDRVDGYGKIEYVDIIQPTINDVFMQLIGEVEGDRE